MGYGAAFAQMGYGKPEDIKQVQQKTLLIVLDAPNDAESKKLSKKKEDLAEYEKEINDYNEALKEVFPKTWTFSKNIEFVTPEQFETILDDKTKSKQYAFFNNVVNRNTFLSSSTNSTGGISRVPRTYSHNLGLTDQNKPVYTMMYYTLHPTKGDLVFIIQQIQNYLAMRLEDKPRKELMADLVVKSALLKNKTLLLDEELTDKKVIDKMAEVYKYKYKITTKQEIDDAILAHNNTVAYIRLIPVAQMIDRPLNKQRSYDPPTVTTSEMIFTQYIIDAENGEGLSFISGATGNKTTINDIKILVKNIEAK